MGTRRLVVVGGGIAGTAAAFGARKRLDAEGRADVEVLLLEEGSEVGGKARSLVHGDFLLEAGPNGFLDARGELDELVAAAGLEKLAADGAAARRYLVRGARAREIRPNPLAFAASGILSPLALLRLALEPCVPRRRDQGEESAFDFAARRLGRQAAERLVSPMVQGIYAGDARALSLGAAFPRLAELEREHGSLVRGMLARRRAARRTGQAPGGGPAGPAGTLTSFAAGLQALPLGLARRGGFAARTGARVSGLEAPGPGGVWRIALEGAAEALRADALVLAVPAPAAATLLRTVLPDAARELEGIDCPPVVVVGLGFCAADAPAVPPGFGALVPRGEGCSAIGVLFESQIFAGRAPRGGLLVRVMLGGALERGVEGLADEALVAAARADLERLFGVRARPTWSALARWPRAIPQYALGHGERLARIEAARAELSRRAAPLHLCGNWRGGVAFARAALTGLETGRAAARELLRADAARTGGPG